ncbi:uncharacterized protein si:dkey-192g7.3 isoform X2 [Trichomycterus rosablanca]|uniref:uncharacterized protein si:dkey-192g7.3 isoform X2 n=1 Tax=Trichomycterus rosablanca TaxID=2290929 RepID=UPI002F34FE57
MMPSRLVITVLVLSLSFMDIYAAENIQKINVTVGENVLLPCPCPKNTDQVVWQIDDDIVNMYSEKNNSEKVHEFYINRTQLFTKSEKENCSLLLLNASSLDMKNFTCNLFSPFLSTSTVELNVVSHEKPDSGSFIAPSPTPHPISARQSSSH